MSNKDGVKKASLIEIADERLKCAICTHLAVGPLQVKCSHRICTSCARRLKQQSALTFFCQKCKKIVKFINYFRDEAVAKKIDNTVISCPQCIWTGEYRHFMGHDCGMEHKGCNEVFIRSKNDDHVQVQKYKYKDASITALLNSPNHLVTKENSVMEQCSFSFVGCQFVGNKLELSLHMEKEAHSHLGYICDFLLTQSTHKKINGFNHVHNYDHQTLQLQSLNSKLEDAKVTIEQLNNQNDKNRLQVSDLQSQQRDASSRLNGVEDLLTTLQATINEINHTYEEVSLTLQTLQATSYDGKYIWKIPDITRRRRDALLGKTISLYSAPFYTDRFGYRMCVRIYLDGDGSGKGCYISYFLTIMKGECNALLEWPFQLTVTLSMINQKGNGNIVQSFKPNPNSASFHRPKSDMNVASGCPKFAALSVLDNPEFIVDDVAFFQCVVNTK